MKKIDPNKVKLGDAVSLCGVPFSYFVNAKSGLYSIKVTQHIPRGYYYSCLNEVHAYFEEHILPVLEAYKDTPMKVTKFKTDHNTEKLSITFNDTTEIYYKWEHREEVKIIFNSNYSYCGRALDNHMDLFNRLVPFMAITVEQ